MKVRLGSAVPLFLLIPLALAVFAQSPQESDEAEEAAAFTSQAYLLVEHVGSSDRIVYAELFRDPAAPVPAGYLSPEFEDTVDVAAAEMSAILSSLSGLGFFSETDESEPLLAELGAYRFTLVEDGEPTFTVALGRVTSRFYLDNALQSNLLANIPALQTVAGLIHRTNY